MIVKDALAGGTCEIVNIVWLLQSVKKKRALQAGPYRLEDSSKISKNRTAKTESTADIQGNKRKLRNAHSDSDGSSGKKPKPVERDVHNPALCAKTKCPCDGEKSEKLLLQVLLILTDPVLI